jgi:biotin operon repressor
MDDEKIMDAFRRASRNGQKELSIGELALVTGSTPAMVWKRMESLKKSGEVTEGGTKKSKYFRANPQLL